MKIIDREEKEAHAAHVMAEGFRGMFYGSIISAGLFAYLKTRHPARFAKFNTSIKACVLIMPTISLAAFYADDGSLEFDKKMYSAGHTNKQVLEQYREWKNMPASDRIVTLLSTHKYKIILASWAASMYGSWKLVNRDKIMTAPQKLVQARMYAQAITVVLLLATMVLAMKEEEVKSHQPAPLPEWRRVLIDREAAAMESQREEVTAE
ncbi:hypothetical protein METBIDRAFT_30473 [Metschnikowia bicuspidata var. bicuspidata NRRL YB-4993]|uniref:HIG1 domain-containing protein n=1 Tax=Metschnikowia bicuspidata var. bicuspidata NRRL YB-4993 TaxID=869754 RepID=A0A1A0HJE5_9ASCO|nr:hypothetical protein METBIDRAFT_30473 [Metschnikowia bicuspidata var. bicuspidata NRRL YB-4993]OBA24135.1 hypothetical protein METBIDRAFT_30473 [Metschnikowia bicuspidata var. bicuspidata NRRL YB-4993]